MVLTIHTTTEIAAPPSEVRATFFDFPSWPSWSHTGPVKSITLPNGTINPGDVLSCELSGGTKISPVVTENSPTTLSWTGALPLNLFVGLHYFKFEESAVTPGHTTFVHGEEFWGPLVWVGSWWPGIREKGERGYRALGEELKGWVEGGAQGAKAKL